MAIGIFKKIKNGLKKAFNAVKTGAKWLNNKVIKPVVKPILNAAAPAINSVAPGVGTAIQTGVNLGSRILDGDRGAVSEAVNLVRRR